MVALVVLVAFLIVCRSTCHAQDGDDAVTWKEAPVNCKTKHRRSLWENYVCELENGPALQKECRPRYILSEEQPPRGLIVAFHGYTACPDSFESMIEAWVPAGYNVMLPLLPGHGREPGECANADSKAYDDLSICVDGTRVDGLPLSRQGYLDFVQQINAIVKHEKMINSLDQAFAAGLSLGGPVASYAVSSSEGGLYDASLLMNTFFGFSSPDADRVFTECIQDQLSTPECIALLLAGQRIDELGDDVGIAPQGFREFAVETLRENLPGDYSYMNYAIANAKIRSTITDLAENYDSLGDIAKDSLDEATLSWGDQCLEQGERGRGGICSFRLRNLFAAHSFAEYARQLTGSSRSAQAPVQFVTVERDGSTRNSLILQAAQNHIRASNNENDISFCIHRIVPNCELEDTGNQCGVPHSMLSRPESELVPPFELYWEDAIQGNSTRYFQKGTRMGVNTVFVLPLLYEKTVYRWIQRLNKTRV